MELEGLIDEHINEWIVEGQLDRIIDEQINEWIDKKHSENADTSTSVSFDLEL